MMRLLSILEKFRTDIREFVILIEKFKMMKKPLHRGLDLLKYRSPLL